MSCRWAELGVDGDLVVADAQAELIGFAPERLWNPSPAVDHRTAPYEVPRQLQMGIRITQESGAKFSPPPFAVVVEAGRRRALVALGADAGWHLWNQVDFAADARGVKAFIDLEGHSDPCAAREHVRVCVMDGRRGEGRMDLVARGMRTLYPEVPRGRGRMPRWWLRPIYCGWGDQVAEAMWRGGVGPEGRAGAYCTQELYQRWVDRLVKAGVPIGTVTIDAGWAGSGDWEPVTRRWPDLKGFIARQHEAGRRVLLWVGTWVCRALPAKWCVSAGGHRVCVDPTDPDYRGYLREQVQRLVSPDGYDADGFKIDQNSRCPSERAPRFTRHSVGPPGRGVKRGKLRLAGEGWGCELLHQHQKDFYDAAKSVKPQALVTSSTAHPYFHDTFDMVRLHDTGAVPEGMDVMDAMEARAALARAALPGKPIDTDDWVSRDYAMWMRYTTRSRTLGVPCIFYSERFMRNWRAEPATRPIPLRDLRKIAAAWKGL